MSQSMTSGDLDLAMEVATRGSLTFYDSEPRGQEGHLSNIATVLGLDPAETPRLLLIADAFEDDHHYEVERVPMEQPQQGSKGESFPKKFRVTIKPA